MGKEEFEDITGVAKSSVLAKELNHKGVVDTGGSELGVSHNIIADAGTGMLIELMAKPKRKLYTGEFKERDNHIFVPFDAVKGIKDIILVDSKKIRKGYAENLGRIGQPTLKVDSEGKKEEIERVPKTIRKRLPGAIKEGISE